MPEFMHSFNGSLCEETAKQNLGKAPPTLEERSFIGMAEIPKVGIAVF
jgi:hypothetical protein